MGDDQFEQGNCFTMLPKPADGWPACMYARTDRHGELDDCTCDADDPNLPDCGMGSGPCPHFKCDLLAIIALAQGYIANYLKREEDAAQTIKTFREVVVKGLSGNATEEEIMAALTPFERETVERARAKPCKGK